MTGTLVTSGDVGKRVSSEAKGRSAAFGRGEGHDEFSTAMPWIPLYVASCTVNMGCRVYHCCT